MLRDLISKFTKPSTPPSVLSQKSQLSLSQRAKVAFPDPLTVAKVATVAVAKVENRKIEGADQPSVECRGASAPGSGTGLDWLPAPPDDTDPAFNGWWAAFDLADLCKLYDVRVVRAGERIVAVYPPAQGPELIAYAGSLLVEARPYLTARLDKLPILTPTQAVEFILGIMRQHPGLRFCRGDGGSRWPLYPRHWSAGQRVTLQSLWYIAGENLDADSFIGIGTG
jgi:hypothetical protein